MVIATCYMVTRWLKATQSLNDPFRIRTNLGNARSHVGFPGTLTTSEGSRSWTHWYFPREHDYGQENCRSAWSGRRTSVT
jgi:hypothetical protein